MDNIAEDLKGTPITNQLKHLKDLGYNCEVREYSDFMRLFTYLDSHMIIQKYNKDGSYVNMYIVKNKQNEIIKSAD